MTTPKVTRSPKQRSALRGGDVNVLVSIEILRDACMKNAERIGAALLALSLAACATPVSRPPAATHLGVEEKPVAAGEIPAPVQQTLTLPKPKPSTRAETYSVVVNNVRVQDLLFSLARDARLNVDVHPGITGTITLNAIDQTLPQLLNRISKQVDMRWEIDGPNLLVMPDSPYLRNYKVDYVNMSRDADGSIQVTGEIADSGSVTGGASVAGNTSSSTKIESHTKNRFWETLVQNIKDILRETDKILPEGSSETVVEQAASQAGTTPPVPAPARSSNPYATGTPGGTTSQQSAGTTVVKRVTFREAASVIANPETGVLTIRATARQHEKIQEFLDQVLASAKRQVLIEATIVEVTLSQNYQQGIDWGRLRIDATRSGIIGGTFDPVIGTTGGAQLVLGRAADGSADGAVRLLEQFGNVKTLSSPKISVLNNQTAVLKVVDNLVYFNVKVETNQNANNTVTNVTTTPRTASVGFVMSVIPQISENDSVLLNVRPSITRLIRFVQDPNPQLGTTPNQVPEIRTREMESMLRVESGNIAVMGGLMEDTRRNDDRAVPFFNRIPVLGALFTQRNDTNTKTELVIFLRPVVIREASIAGDYKNFREQLPRADFFNKGFTPPRYQVLPTTPSGALQ